MAVKWMMLGGFLALVVTWQQVEGRPPHDSAPSVQSSAAETTEKCPRVIPKEIDVVCKDIEEGGRFTEMVCIDRFRNTFKLIRPSGPQVPE